MAVAQVVNTGTQANDATGDLLRDAFTKINTNFAALFAGNFPAAQMTVGPPLAGTALTVVGIAGQNAISTTIGTVNFAAPTSGNTLTAIGVSGSAAIVATAASATDIALTASGSVTLGSTASSTITFNGAVNAVNSLTVGGVAVSTSVGANPTSLVGLTTVNGSATTWMRSDGAPAIDQSIAPTWTSTHSYTKSGAGPSVKNDIGFFQVLNTAGTGVAVIGTVKSFIGGAGSTTDLAIGAVAGLHLYAGNSSSSSIDISGTTRGVTVNAPSSGDALTATNVAGANALTLVGNSAGTAVLRLNTQATTGAQAVTLAITNKPGASGQTTPAKWVPINLDGTTYYIPAFS